ncbi:MAG: UvrD-helicase domain-containing protein [Marinilabiliaceae bacterium]|nr:UvrD-helicase domain-containing protein [Marinilabiliaceae bacterium]
MSTLKIYRASAGSGKTYTLTREFINLLFAHDEDYRHTLAVTFTNKATAEMKGRIIKSLYELWTTNLHSDWMAELAQKAGSEEAVRRKAEKILHLLLHDFSRFSISTIDSFFQKIIRAFIQELGLFSGYKTELNNTKILQLAVDRLVMKLGQPDKQELRQWLINFSYERMEGGKSWNIADEIMQLGRQVNAETFQGFHASFIQKLNDKLFLESYKNELKRVVDTFNDTMVTYGQSMMSMMKAHGVTWDDFIKKSNTPFKVIENLALHKNFDKLPNLKAYLNAPDTWYLKTNKQAESKILPLYHAGLNNQLSEVIEFYDKHLPAYNTANVILQNFNALAILNDIANEMDMICKEEGIFLLSNSNRLLNRIIDENDSPFIYEKSGTRYKHFMIDEFQDTSTLQWSNFRPLIGNSLAADDYSLLVGDVKQSIYRWRNSDWKLLAGQVKTDFEHQGYVEKNLDTNWRSRETIIAFNNRVFEKASNVLQADFNADLVHADAALSQKWGDRIVEAYHDVKQKVAAKNIHSGGQVHIRFIEGNTKAEYQEMAVKLAIQKVDDIISQGYSFKDICFLVRKTDEARLVTNALLSGQYSSRPYPVVSNEALVLGSSAAVMMVVNQLCHILSHDNQVYKAYIDLYSSVLTSDEPDGVEADLLHTVIDTKNILQLKGLPLIDLVQRLVQQLPPNRHVSEGVFLQAFTDIVIEYVQNEMADLAGFIEWWEAEGKMRSVSVPEDQDAIRVMTIHKSKGLEFETVIMPFLNWELEDSKHKAILWCEDPFSKLDYIPVRFDKKLLDTYFANNYLDEHLHNYVDNLNLLYVAFTRACAGLFCFCPLPGEKFKTIGDLLFLSLSDPMVRRDFEIIADVQSQQQLGNDDSFLVGDLPPCALHSPSHQAQTPEFSTWPLPMMHTWPYADRVAIFKESEGFMDQSSRLQINKGKQMHRLFELIKTHEDIEKAVNQLVLEGWITTDDVDHMQSYVRQLIAAPEVALWFKAGLVVLNERSLLSSRGTFRPDRVVLDDKVLKIIDYKFGDVHAKEHERQVANYVNLAARMKYEKVEGYLWYVSENKVVKVTPSHPTLF